MTFKQFLENADDLRRLLQAKAEDIDFLVDVYLKWHKAMKNRKYWSGRNEEQYLANRDEEVKLANIWANYPSEMRALAQEWGRRKLNLS